MIKNIIFTAVIFSLMILKAFSEDKWYTLHQEDLNFSVDFPSEPDYFLDKVSYQEQIVYSKTWTASDTNYGGSSTIFQIFQIQFNNEDQTLSNDSSQRYNTSNFIKEFEKSDSLFKIQSSEIKYNGLLGIESIFENKINNQRLLCRTFWAKSSIINLTIAAKMDIQSISPSADKFFNSFRLKESNFSQIDTYKITFPGEKTQEQKSIKIGGKEVLFYVYNLDQQDSKNLSFFTSELPSLFKSSSFSSDDDLNNLYSYLGELSAAEIKGKVISDKDIYCKDVLGKEIKIQSSSKFLVLRYFLHNSILYTLRVTTSAENENNSEMLDFFNSFEIIEE